jgi:curved DNA-binding protein CbpA
MVGRAWICTSCSAYPPDASRDEIALAWRCRARAEHADSRPGDADAPGRFRALAEAWQVLGDPARRAAYDRALARERQPAVRGLFSISVAAELAGLHPQTLRIYEREGLLDPARSAGGTRRYSRRDIDRLQEICALTADGLNLAGIRRVCSCRRKPGSCRPSWPG